MTTYREIVGKKIKKVTSDPSTGIDGQMWYNSTTGAIRGLALLEAWTSGSPMINQTRQRYATGTQTAALVFGGYLNPNTNTGLTEEYNGSGYSAGGTMSTARRSPGGAGTQTSSLAIGGYSSSEVTTVEEYNGSSWTSSPALNNAKFIAGSFGTSSACVTEGGAPAPKAFETWDDSSWTAGPGPIGPANSYGAAGAGTSTAGLFAGGYPASPTDNLTRAVEWDGSSFSSTGSMNTARGYMGGFGVQTSAVICGGKTGPGPNSTATETYDGSSFTTSPATLGTALAYGGACGTSSAGLAAGFSAHPPSFPTLSEEYNSSTNVVTAAAWSSGGAMGTARVLGGSACSSQTSGIVFGGSSPYTANTESYDGTSWTELNNMVLGRSYIAGFGTATAAVGAGGYLTSPSPGSPGNMKSEVEEWDGSSWSEQTNLPGARLSAGSCGTQTAGLLFGGATSQPFNPTIQTGTFEYDGSSWTAGGALPEAKAQGNSGGIQTAAFFASGRTVPGSRSTKTAFYNGTSWSEGADVVTVSPGTGNTGATGTTSAGQATSDANLTNNYDGTAWATAPNYSTARSRSQGGGTQTSNIFAGGYSPSSPNYRTDTEEFTGETETANVKTFSTS